ncbi:helix-turn-helix domain-containing protein [Streptomyces sp. NPDC086023]|uniref:helix-turn-helix domain-containing protein n=1 Tax=Streptomyces sp. NPDC086023 TaxID=3365746 RepID=UPI0037CFB702
MPSRNPDRGVSVSTVLGRRLGSELLGMREALGLRQVHAAEALTASVAKVAKMERGQVPMRDPDVRALCHLYGESDPEVVERLLGLARLDRERRRARGWWRQGLDVGGLGEYIAMEDAATQIRTWQTALVPGLLQTADYVRAMCVVSETWKDPDEIEPVVSVRMKRQARLSGERPLRFHAVISEGALRQQVGGPDVMRAQLAHLVNMAEMPNVHVQVLPYRAGAHPCMSGAFSILSFAEPGAVDVAYTESIASAVWVESANGNAIYDRSFDRIARMSLAPRDSVELIHDIGKGM